MRRISSSAPTSTLMPSSPSTNGTGISIKEDWRSRQYCVLNLRERGLQRVRALLAGKVFAAPYRTVLFLSSIYTGCTWCLLSCQDLIVLNFNCTVETELSVLFVNQLMEAAGVGDVSMGM